MNYYLEAFYEESNKLLRLDTITDIDLIFKIINAYNTLIIYAVDHATASEGEYYNQIRPNLLRLLRQCHTKHTYNYLTNRYQQ